jgi:O-antigen/teichoic acid export membrane protein
MGLKNILKNELFLASLTLMILINIGNVINYVFHFSMARFLGPIDYGVFAVLTNIIYIFSVPALSIQTLVSKYTIKYKINREYGKINGVMNSLIKETAVISLVLYILFLIISLFIYQYLNISFYLLALTGLFIFLAFTYPILTGILQGMKKFNVWGWNFIISCIFKFVIALALVILGFKVYGAVLGVIIGALISFLLVFPFINEITGSKKIEEKINIFSGQSISTFLVMLVIVLMYSLDVIIVKIFFQSDIAGKYAIASLLGKMIFFGTSAIGSAMFPISSEKYETGKKSRGVIRKTYIAVGLMCFTAVLVFFFFPNLVIGILFGANYLSIANILVYVGIAFSFLSMLNIFVLYRISISNFKMIHAFILSILLILQVLALVYFTSDLKSFSISFMTSSIIIFIASILFIRR